MNHGQVLMLIIYVLCIAVFFMAILIYDKAESRDVTGLKSKLRSMKEEQDTINRATDLQMGILQRRTIKVKFPEVLQIEIKQATTVRGPGKKELGKGLGALLNESKK